MPVGEREAGKGGGALAAYRQYVAKETRPSEARWLERAKERITEFEAAAERREAAVHAAARRAGRVQKKQEAAPDAAGLKAERIAAGDAALAARDHRGALSAYQDAALADPRSAEAFVKVATAEARLGYDDAAIEHFSRALSLEPGSVAALEGLAAARGRQARRADGQEAWTVWDASISPMTRRSIWPVVIPRRLAAASSSMACHNGSSSASSTTSWSDRATLGEMASNRGCTASPALEGVFGGAPAGVTGHDNSVSIRPRAGGIVNNRTPGDKAQLLGSPATDQLGGVVWPRKLSFGLSVGGRYANIRARAMPRPAANLRFWLKLDWVRF